MLNDRSYDTELFQALLAEWVWDGGTILILCLGLFLGKEQHTAQGANLIFFIPTSLVAIFLNLKQKLIDWKTGITVMIFGIIGAMIGAEISIHLETEKLKLYFGIFLLIIAGFEIYAMRKYIFKDKSKQ